MSVLRRYGWIGLFYTAIVGTIAIEKSLRLSIDQNTVLLLVLLAVPFLIPRIETLTYGKLRIELAKVKQEVGKEVSEVRDRYDELSERLAKLAEQSSSYLKEQPLYDSDLEAAKIRANVSLSDAEIDMALASIDPNLRLQAYFQLQVRPRPRFFDGLIDCYWLEQLLARRLKETRPMWQLLVATEVMLRLPEVLETEKQRAERLLRQTLDFLQGDASVDTGGECKRRIELILNALS